MLVACFQILLLTQSRAAWLALMSVLAVISVWYLARRMTALSPPRRRAMVGVMLAVALVCGAAIYRDRAIVADRLALAVAGTSAAAQAGPLHVSTRVRLDLWRVGMTKIAERPWFGWGPDSAKMLISRGASEPANGFRDFHNLYVHVLVTLGVVGALLGFGVWALLWRRVAQAMRAGWMPRNVGIFAFGAIALYSIACFFQLRYDGASGRLYVSLLFAVAYTYWLHRPSATNTDAGLSPPRPRP
jgi:O-antigen ligase